MVHEDKYHSVPQQGGHFQTEARAVTFGQLLPRLLGRERRQQGGQVPSLEVQPGQPSPSEFIPTVSVFGCRQLPSRFTHLVDSLTQATDTSNIRLVFAAVKETILNNALKDSGIL
jgi:hypothetical protein